ncbi:hypothetical protein GCM10017589_26510 [Streptomyces poonensis]|nr:hypothetical protein GCM10017589_26510 [Streptomyces poonensis]
MGVFARLLRKSKSAEEAPVAEAPDSEAQAAAPAVDPGVDGPQSPGLGTPDVTETPDASDAGSGSAQASPGTAGTATEVGRTPDTEGGDGADGVPPEESGGTADLEIPAQQTAAKAADNETGEGART